MSPKSEENGCVAVLGGTGWVGRHVCEAFASRGHRVVALARNPVPGVRHDAFVRLDLAAAAPGTIAEILRAEEVRVVVNATDAANATDGWDRTEEQLARVNVDLVRRLLSAITSLPRRPRLVHLGTIHEYGAVEPGVAIDETVVPKPVSGYARTKLAGSNAVLEAAHTGLVDGVVLRAVNVCGPHPSPVSLPGRLLRLLDEATRTGRMEVSVATDRRDFVDVRDLADAILRAADRPGLGCAVNIGSGTAVPMRDFVTLFVTSAGYPASILVERPRPVRSLGGAWIEADIRRAGKLLDWVPRIPLGRSLRAMWETFRAG
ncbi:NAD-dependent epimerase/dehydratase family protein [Micromonospora halophytica]|uniref:Nucleoside-diphosphate-sugar epimerase n=1 Tax=Micromonospora halophytica TaxID=47864 RepID=A0A1C5IJT2_9ACTN|nr:NAD(P)-dependent oxidoreductase [Micromonospora halophytica]SCG58622.1 Nucleoside-diphosphate-sugar epimerase [Micromonospora halophytica]